MVSAKALTFGFIAMWSLIGVYAGPCKPNTSQTLSSVTASGTISTGTDTTTETPTTTAETVTTHEAVTSTTTTESCVATNIVQNPGFDNPSDGSPWTYESPHFGYGTDFPRSPNQEGVFSAEVHQGGVTQTIPELVESKAYTFSYYWSRDEFFEDGASCQITVTAGVVLDTLSVSDGARYSYQQRQFTVDAGTITSSTVEINALCDGVVDILIDDVSVVPICLGD